MNGYSERRGFLGQGVLPLFLSVLILGLAFLLATGTSGTEEPRKPEASDANTDRGSPTHLTPQPSENPRVDPRVSEDMDMSLEEPMFHLLYSDGKIIRVPFKPRESTPKDKGDRSDP